LDERSFWCLVDLVDYRDDLDTIVGGVGHNNELVSWITAEPVEGKEHDGINEVLLDGLS
jgi:hypothetical protein